jgi:hypothetical protein
MDVESTPLARPRLYLVLGAECTGTKLVTSILIAGGCAGSADHTQPWDGGELPGTDLSNVVIRRSVPHNGDWSAGAYYIAKLRDTHDVTAVVTTRALYAVVNSQQKTIAYVSSREVAAVNCRRAYRTIFGTLSAYGVGFVIVPYESLVTDGSLGQRLLLAQLGLLDDIDGCYTPIDVDNCNEKHMRPMFAWFRNRKGKK